MSMLPKVMQVKNFGKVSPTPSLHLHPHSHSFHKDEVLTTKRHPEQNIPILQTKIHQLEDGVTPPERHSGAEAQVVRVVKGRMRDVGIVVDLTRGKIALIMKWRMIPCRSYRDIKVPAPGPGVVEVVMGEEEEVLVLVGLGEIHQRWVLDLGKVRGQEDRDTDKKVKNAGLTRRERGMKGTVREGQEMTEVGAGMSLQGGIEIVMSTLGMMIGEIGTRITVGNVGIGIENVDEVGVGVREGRKIVGEGTIVIVIVSVTATGRGRGIGIVDDPKSDSDHLSLLHVRYYQNVCTIISHPLSASGSIYYFPPYLPYCMYELELHGRRPSGAMMMLSLLLERRCRLYHSILVCSLRSREGGQHPAEDHTGRSCPSRRLKGIAQRLKGERWLIIEEETKRWIWMREREKGDG